MATNRTLEESTVSSLADTGCTGFTADFSWIQGLELDDHGAPVHANGVSSIPGLYFNGFPWLRNRASGLIYGAVRDSEHIAGMITEGFR